MYNQYLNMLGDIPGFLIKYLEVPSFIRLKKVGYFCGMDNASKDIYDFKEYISRYDHSLSVALLTWKLTKNKKATLAALFHDISTPCFSHVIDYMNNDYSNQESTEEYTEYILKNDKKLNKLLKEDNIELSDLDFKKYNIVDNNRPLLCTDRLDGIILTGLFWTKSLNINDISNILNDIEIVNEEIGFKSREICEFVLKVNNDIDKYCHSKEDNYMMELLATITKSAITKGIITYKELYYLTEEELFNKLYNSNDMEIINNLYVFKNVKLVDIPNINLPKVKVRTLNPLVNGVRIK